MCEMHPITISVLQNDQSTEINADVYEKFLYLYSNIV